jgi:hypothetical protein
MTGFVLPNTPDVEKDLRLYQVMVEQLTGIDFNLDLPRVKAYVLEAKNGGDWLCRAMIENFPNSIRSLKNSLMKIS